jgi:anti-sigma factor RsiW
VTAPISEDDLHALVDGRLSAARQTEVEAWLDHHPEARVRVNAWRRQNHDLRAVFSGIEDEPAPARLNNRNLAAGRRFWRGDRPGAAAAVAAAVLLLALGGAAGWTLHGWSRPAPSRGIEALAQEAAASYAVYAPDLERPIEIPASDLAALDQWVSRRIGRPVRAPDLSGSGFRLLGGRLVATPNGPAGMFLYQAEDGARVAMLVRPMEIDKTASMRRRVEGATEGYAWADRGLGYSMVAAQGAEGLARLSREARRQAVQTRV